MKHLAKNVYIKKLDKYNFELLEKGHPKNKEGKVATNDDGSLKIRHETLGYYSNWSRVASKLDDLAMGEWVNGDVNACRAFINEAVSNLKEYFDDVR